MLKKLQSNIFSFMILLLIIPPPDALLICSSPPWHDCLWNLYGAKNTEACVGPTRGGAGIETAGGARGFGLLILWHKKPTEDSDSEHCTRLGQSFGTEEGHVHGLQYTIETISEYTIW